MSAEKSSNYVMLSVGLCFLWAIPSAQAALEASQVLILVNKDTPISSQVGRMYQKLREIPPANLLSLSLGTEREITPEQYWAKAVPPIKKFLEANPAIRCVLTTSGVPYIIQSAGKDDGPAFDSELALILREQPGDRKLGQPNPLYTGAANAYGVTDPRRMQMIFVVRLDGLDLKTITRMVEDAIAVEKSGFAGPVFGDAQGMEEITGYGYGDTSIRSAIDRFSGAGFDAKLDMKRESWQQPKGGVGDQAAGAAFYVGWYDLRNFQDIFGRQGLARGSIAWHIASLECQNLWDPASKGWCMNLLRRGAAVTLGPVREPYVTAFPRGDIFAEALLSGGSLAESYWLATPQASWAMVVLGDPLYRPFALKPQPALVARAYVAGDSNHVLEKGETTSLQVLIECLGPAGSGTLALTGVAEPEKGLAAASGSFTIPPLKAGQTVVIRIPSVTAGTDPTGTFRLRLNAQDDQKQSRRIVLEGRIGFSRLSGGLLPKSQMFVNARGEALITGRPGDSMLVETETLNSQNITPPNGLAVIGADFSPNGGRIALALFDAQQKKGGTLLTDSKLGGIQQLPAGAQFLRWLGNDEVLLKTGDHLTRHPLAGGEDHIFNPPAGWPGPIVSGNVIPGTDIQYVVSASGQVGVQKGSQPVQEVLEGTKATRFAAIANDLSVFGGVDSEKRLWVQRGMDAKPEVVASGVEGVIWGPISRRAVVLGANNQSRVYDGRDGSWIDLGTIAGAQWSPDEEQLLFVEGGFLSVLSGHRIEKLCDVNRIGTLTRAVISARGDKAFLLAGIGGGLDVWMMALPSQASSPNK